MKTVTMNAHFNLNRYIRIGSNVGSSDDMTSDYWQMSKKL
jgi:hypothetical protein